jgi:hypothetical protein
MMWRRGRWARLCCAGLLMAGEAVTAGAQESHPAPHVSHAPPQELRALFGVGAQPCRTFIDVSGEADSREIALAGAMFSWAQGWFSARNLIGHESNPLAVGGTLSPESLKGMLVEECKEHPDEAIFLAVDDLYVRLQKKGL